MHPWNSIRALARMQHQIVVWQDALIIIVSPWFPPMRVFVLEIEMPLAAV